MKGCIDLTRNEGHGFLIESRALPFIIHVLYVVRSAACTKNGEMNDSRTLEKNAAAVLVAKRTTLIHNSAVHWTA